MKVKKFTIEHFIKKFEAIPSENIISDSQSNIDGTKRCAVGWMEHNTMGNNYTCSKNTESSDECKALEKLFFNAGIKSESSFRTEDRHGWNIADVNNGRHSMFKQETPKERILAALQYVKESQLVTA